MRYYQNCKTHHFLVKDIYYEKKARAPCVCSSSAMFSPVKVGSPVNQPTPDIKFSTTLMLSGHTLQQYAKIGELHKTVSPVKFGQIHPGGRQRNLRLTAMGRRMNTRNHRRRTLYKQERGERDIFPIPAQAANDHRHQAKRRQGRCTRKIRPATSDNSKTS